MQWTPTYYKFRERGVIPESENKLGFIANELKAISPDCVSGEGLPEGAHKDLESADISLAYNVEPVAMIATLTLAIQEQQKQITRLQEQIL